MEHVGTRALSPPLGRLRVLHVTEAVGGGVATAISQYSRNTPDCDHARLQVGRDESSISNCGDPSQPELALRARPHKALALAIRSFGPDIVHAHSAWAGVLTRATTARAPVVYSPHCYAFERQDVGTALRGFYRRAEELLGCRTAVLCAASAREHGLARELYDGRRSPVVRLVPHAVESLASSPRQALANGLRVAAIGRLSPQKDPALFARIAESSAESELGTSFTWIGGGDSEFEGHLAALGVRVTGWVGSEELRSELKQVDVLIHTAQWEVGDPYATIDAASQAVPVLLLKTPSTCLNLIGEMFVDELEAVRLLDRLNDPARYHRASIAALEAASKFTPEAQRLELMAAYEAAMKAQMNSPHEGQVNQSYPELN